MGKTDQELIKEARERREEAFPITLFDAIDEGESPVRLFREYRGLSQEELAIAVGVDCQIIECAEQGINIDVEIYVAISKVLNVGLENFTEIL
ncbi:MAG: helix-turn-helix domain-containing protein [Rickettsiales bacterium]|nr:helix-turn-helix domain-containing protein [Rickettsiales bacterium]